METPIKILPNSATLDDSVRLKPVSRKAKLLNVATAVCLLAVCLMAAMVFTVGILAIQKGINGKGSTDFVEYWAAAQLLVHGQDPYDATATLRLEQSAGRSEDRAEITFSPPLIFFLITPLGLVGAKTGAILWMIFLIAALITSIHLLWIVNGRRSGQLHLLCYCFAPTLICLVAGQIGIFLLLGIVLFSWLYKRWPLFAGAALVVCLVKPHLFLVFGTVLLLWAINTRQFRILAGFGVGLLAACLFALLMDPHAWSHYSQMLVIQKPTEPLVPSLSRMLRFFVHRDWVWLQFVPAAAGVCWSIWYFWRRRERWNWMEHESLLLLVSVACAPYAWITDESVLLPAILVSLYRATDSGRTLLLFGLINAAILLEVLRGVWIITPYFVWTAPAWLAWYLYATYGRNRADALGNLEKGRA